MYRGAYLSLHRPVASFDVVFLTLQTRDEAVKFLELLRQSAGVGSTDLKRFDPLLENGSLLSLQLLLRLTTLSLGLQQT